ncbi:DNA-processing protein DprA [Paracidovorax valerianellae]|uniref:Predicted Rossmann fold nucleotide-binding protein DprA/Smf involved in DNA uptake n=1 Tax=Paracidovorax valerianellae TaxID=187868 RepID=A0A1G6M827_9BURK|nr:DNA-processing protein DprA [Paracidovorax valerianellae]MDA8446077.1 DNA-processing protein DprA [Paracidovorax valerianellae]SDC51095.1 Predicted Rossmann fold nucleotide-binding protein DprA/Smf involved in DNA uptake [Paracidovorax valerianellae]
MSLQISENCQAILLLTAPLMVGKVGARAELLKQSEYSDLTRFLVQEGFQPSDLLRPQSPALRQAENLFGPGRLTRLVGRGFQLAQALDYWSARSIWVVSRADARYPKRVKSRLKHEAPPVMYGCGDLDLVDNGGLAVVGSRDADDEMLSYAQRAGERAASAGRGLISGGAKGVDSAAMDGAEALGGIVCNVMAEGLAQAAISRRFRDGLQERRTLLVSPYDPSAGFNVGHAIARNKFIFALADVGLVVNSDLERGGTWAGAIEQLRKLRFVPLYIRSSGKRSVGLDALLREGALPWPEPENSEALKVLFENRSNDSQAPAYQEHFDFKIAAGAPSGVSDAVLHPARQVSILEDPRSDPDAIEEGASDQASATAKSTFVEASSGTPVGLEQEMFATFERLIRQVLYAPKKAAQIADELDLNQMQTRDWLNRLVAKGVIEKKKSNATYRLAA